jgi:hypothetical protein
MKMARPHHPNRLPEKIAFAINQLPSVLLFSASLQRAFYDFCCVLFAASLALSSSDALWSADRIPFAGHLLQRSQRQSEQPQMHVLSHSAPPRARQLSVPDMKARWIKDSEPINIYRSPWLTKAFLTTPVKNIQRSPKHWY